MAYNILYIEDELFLGDVMVEAFKKAGHSVSIAVDGEQGIGLAQKNPFDLILLDLLLPKVDGFEVLRQLKENEKTKDIPVVILSNLSAKEDTDRTNKLGATHFFVKAMTDPKEIVAYADFLLSQNKKSAPSA